MEVHPEVLWKVPEVDKGLHQCGQIMNQVLLVTRAPDEGCVHESPHDANSWGGKVPFRSGNACPQLCPSQCMSSLSSIVSITENSIVIAHF